MSAVSTGHVFNMHSPLQELSIVFLDTHGFRRWTMKRIAREGLIPTMSMHQVVKAMINPLVLLLSSYIEARV